MEPEWPKKHMRRDRVQMWINNFTISYTWNQTNFPLSQRNGQLIHLSAILEMQLQFSLNLEQCFKTQKQRTFHDLPKTSKLNEHILMVIIVPRENCGLLLGEIKRSNADWLGPAWVWPETMEPKCPKYPNALRTSGQRGQVSACQMCELIADIWSF